MKRWLISKCNGIVIPRNKNETGAIFKLTCCVYQVIFLCMKCPVKRRVLFYKDMLEKHCAVVKIKLVTYGKYYLLRELLCHTTQNVIPNL